MHIYKFDQNIVYAYYNYISHDIMEFEVVFQFYDSLYHLYIFEDINIPFNFSCDIDFLDQNHILINKFKII